PADPGPRALRHTGRIALSYRTVTVVLTSGEQAMSEWNATTYEGKPTILRVVREQAERMFALAEKPEAWEAPTACESWQVRDIIGHLVDTTEGYFRSFEIARSGATGPA